MVQGLSCTQCNNMMVDKNFTELFNAWILEARGKPIIKILEDIRVKVMVLLGDIEAKVRSWNAEYSPAFLNLYSDWRGITHDCKVIFKGYWGYEVFEGIDRHTVNMQQRRCTCRL